MASNEIGDALKKAEEVLEKVSLGWSPEAAAMAGVGYAILALAQVLLGRTESSKNE